MKPGLPDGGGVITRLPVTDGAVTILVPVDVVVWGDAVLGCGPANVSVIPSVVIVVWALEIGNGVTTLNDSRGTNDQC